MSYDSKDLVWTGEHLRLHSARGRTLATLELDETWPSMWRIRLPNRRLSDMTNRTRAKDAAMSLVLADLNWRVAPAEVPPMRSFRQPLSVAVST